MPAPNVLRDKQRKEILPLIQELKQLFEGQTRLSIAARSGITNYQVGRILGESLPAPTYLDMTKLLRVAKLSPNEAAAIVGLYDQDEQDALNQYSAYERRILMLLKRSNLTATQRMLLAQVIEATIMGLEGQNLLDTDSIHLDAEGKSSTQEGEQEEQEEQALPKRLVRTS